MRCVQIINWGPPGSLQMYFQMVGRGGRDMAAARCVLFWSKANVATRRFLQRQDAARRAPTLLSYARDANMVQMLQVPHHHMPT
jgi:superfamily II DNA helicase RecQ